MHLIWRCVVLLFLFVYLQFTGVKFWVSCANTQFTGIKVWHLCVFMCIYFGQVNRLALYMNKITRAYSEFKGKEAETK